MEEKSLKKWKSGWNDTLGRELIRLSKNENEIYTG